ncbi:MAG: aldehyde dehydrogenase (NADP(+)) [Nitriliruptoraceae bacterium]
MPLTAANLIDGRHRAGGTATTRSVDPRTGEAFGPAFPDATEAEVADAVAAATRAFVTLRRADGTTLARLLEVIADRLEALGDDLTAIADRESGLGEARITGERGRTSGQLRAFAEVARTGSHLDVRIDPADPDRTPPRPDLRRMQVPLGPVAVFGASNFPLAFSVPGGDTASALAAGCPVLAKAHPSHPATSQLVGQAIVDAVAELGLPAGTFALLHGRDPSVSRTLVTAPGLAAVGFTGSHTAGRALFDLAAGREVPIPVYAEMGSLNPQVVTEAAIAARGAALAEELIGSITLGTGQFCTKPGLLFVPDSDAGRAFEQQLATVAGAVAPAPLLNQGIGTRLADRLAEVTGLAGVEVAAGGEVGGAAGGAAGAREQAGVWATPTLLVTDAATFARTPTLREECFGPAAIVVRVSSLEAMVALTPTLDGSLTASIHAAEAEVDDLGDLVDALTHRAGRIVWNQVPTGVAVTPAMHHGGPYPASTSARDTSVGTAAIARFLRPVVYQNAPEALLPEPLRDANPTSRWRLVDGEWTNASVG